MKGSQKPGITYFELDVELDTKFELIEAEFGLKGFGVVVKLLQKIYGGDGYYVEWTNEMALLFARKLGVSVGVVSEIVTASVRRGMFDDDIFRKYSILTSKGIQKRYFNAVSRRKEIEIDDNILLVNVAQMCPNVNIVRKNVNILPENVDILQQSRVEKSKVKKSKVEKSIAHTREPAPSAPKAESTKRKKKETFTPPTLEEVRAYAVSKNSPVAPDFFFNYFNESNWVDGRGNEVQNWKQKFLTWDKKEREQIASNPSSKPYEPPEERTEVNF